MCMFVSVELPQGIGNIIAALENSVGWNVTQKWYYPFGECASTKHAVQQTKRCLQVIYLKCSLCSTVQQILCFIAE